MCGWLFLTAWWLITSHPTRKKCFIQPPSGCQTETEILLCSVKSKHLFRACFCILVYLCVNLILSVLFYIKQIPCLPPMICLCRYGTGQRPLLPYEPHLSVDITSSGESSSGFTSQDSTMERCKTGTSPCCITTVIINIFFINSGSHDHSFIVIKSCHLTPQFPSALWSFSGF